MRSPDSRFLFAERPDYETLIQRLILEDKREDPKTSSSRLGCAAAVAAIVSQSQPRGRDPQHVDLGYSTRCHGTLLRGRRWIEARTFLNPRR